MAEYKSSYTGQEIDAGIAKANTALQEHQDISGKVDKVTGKGLSTNDYTTEEKEKLASIDLSEKQDTLISGENIKTINGNSILGEGNLVIEGGTGGLTSVAHDNTLTGAGTNENPLGVDTTKIAQISDIPDTSDFITKSVDDLTNYTKTSDLGDLATQDTVDYETEVTNKPTIPSEVTESTVSGWGFTKNTGDYSKPNSGIPESDLSSDVQGKLNSGGGSGTNAFAGKRVCILGDSISTYQGYIPNGYATYFPYGEVNSVDKTWWYKLIQDLGMVLGRNNSYSGSRVGGSTNQMASLTRIQDLGTNGTPDIILFYGGTNDMLGTVGTFDSTQNYTLDTTTSTWSDFATAYKDAIMRLQHYYPSAVIIAMSPIWVKTTYTPSKVNSGIEVMKKICDYFGVNYIDLRKAGFTTQNLDNTLVDAVHPNVLGMSLIEEYVKKYLMSLITPFETNVVSVTNTLSHVSTNNTSTSITKGTSYNATLTAQNGYVIDTVTVIMNGVDITSTAYNNGVITIANVTGSITITANAVVSGITYTITNNLTNVSTNNNDDSIPEYSSYTATLSTTSSYNITSVTVTMGGTDITSTAYNNGTILIAEVTGNIVITATAVQVVSYTITNNLSNVTNSNIASTITENSSYTATLTAQVNYTIDTVTITMGGTDITSSVYNSSTGVITIAAVTGNIVITATGESIYTPGVLYDFDPGTMATATRSSLSIDNDGFLVQSNASTSFPEILLNSGITEIEFDVEDVGKYSWLIMAGNKDRYGAVALGVETTGTVAIVTNGQNGNVNPSEGSKVTFNTSAGHYRIVKESNGISVYKNSSSFAQFTTASKPIASFTASDICLGFMIQSDSPTGKGYKNIKVKFGNE